MSNAALHSPSLPIDMPDPHGSTRIVQTKSSNSAFPPPPDIEPLPEKSQNSTARSGRATPPKGGAIGTFIYGVHMLSKICGAASAAMFTIAMLIICQLVFMRYVLNASTVWQTEAVIFLMIGATLVGLPYVQMIRGHVNVDLLPMYLKRRNRKILAVIILLFGIAISALFGFYGIELVIDAHNGGWHSETVWGVALWKPYSALPIGFCLLFLQFAADLAGLITDRTTPFDIPEDAA
ncbi:TRAP transporter small permease [Thalassospira mesophila]|uniref:TRAP transporter small permease protein n=1 Tax=Thalassospira mesophila TaxID=1293891 RepID=A0A1Y2KX93_9PROT|nr:TRAP transporter small permease [Thalassospira mesophila]OSQ36567.1 C4-dicarboxylate ABC transporter [Thalassospira mesophila]